MTAAIAGAALALLTLTLLVGLWRARVHLIRVEAASWHAKQQPAPYDWARELDL